jgi:hypothetical protein
VSAAHKPFAAMKAPVGPGIERVRPECQVISATLADMVTMTVFITDTRYGSKGSGLSPFIYPSDSRQRRPVWFDVTSAKIDDVVAGRMLPLEKGATYVFDKGYTDYRWWSQIIDAGAVFVTRRKRNAQCRDIREQPASGEGILAARRLKIGHRQPRGGAPVNPLYQTELREIVVARPDHDQPLYLLTNDFQRPATDIAQLY